MIKEIIKLRGDGLSFRRIASELGTTVGKVQYRWNKWADSTENTENDIQKDEEINTPAVDQTSTDFIPLMGELKAKLVMPRKMILFWDVSELPKKIIELFFNRSFETLVTVVRIYDVTDVIFNGKNAHHFYEITVPYQSGHWFIKGLATNRSYAAELGVYFSEADFFPIFRSNCIQTPRTEIPTGNEHNYDLIQFKQYEERQPKWVEQVSTYSYYLESRNLEDNNG